MRSRYYENPIAKPFRDREPGKEVVTPREFEVMELRFWEGLSEKEIAKRLSISRATVMSYLASARSKMGFTTRRELQRAYLKARTDAVWALDLTTASPIQRFSGEHAADIEDTVGAVLVLYQPPGLRGLASTRVDKFAEDPNPWPLPPELRRLAETPTAGEEGADGAKWALTDIDRPISDIRDTIRLHVRPYRYFWARRTNDLLDEARIGRRTLRDLYWSRVLPLRTSPIGNILVAHVVVTVSSRAGEFILFTRRIDDPRVVSYERGAWSASFEEQCRGDYRLLRGTMKRPAEHSIIETALRGLKEELGIIDAQDVSLLSVILEWANGYTGCVVRLNLDLGRSRELSQLADIERAWRLKHEDREADAVRLVPMSAHVLIPLVFEGRDPGNWLPPPPGHDQRRLHRTTPVRVLHALMSASKLTASDLRRIERALEAFRPDSV